MKQTKNFLDYGDCYGFFKDGSYGLISHRSKPAKHKKIINWFQNSKNQVKMALFISLAALVLSIFGLLLSFS